MRLAWVIAVAGQLLQTRGQATTPLPTDIPTITARFQAMETQLTALTSEVTQLQAGIGQVQAIALDSASGLNSSELELQRVSVTAGANTVEAQRLAQETVSEEARVQAATMQLQQLQGQVRALDGESRDLGTQTVSITTRIATLGREVEAGLPGSGNISSRLAAVRASLSAFQGEVASGHINTLIAQRLRVSFRRATASVNQLAENVTETLQSGPQGIAGANGTATEGAETTVADLLEPLRRTSHLRSGYSPPIAGLVPEE